MPELSPQRREELSSAVELVEESIYQRFLNTRSFSYLTKDELQALRIVLDALADLTAVERENAELREQLAVLQKGGGT
jgi:hypothetical protein